MEIILLIKQRSTKWNTKMGHTTIAPNSKFLDWALSGPKSAKSSARIGAKIGQHCTDWVSRMKSTKKKSNWNLPNRRNEKKAWNKPNILHHAGTLPRSSIQMNECVVFQLWYPHTQRGYQIPTMFTDRGLKKIQDGGGRWRHSSFGKRDEKYWSLLETGGHKSIKTILK